MIRSNAMARNGPKLTTEVMADVKAMTGASPRTIERAREQMKASGEMKATKVGKPWVLHLVNTAASPWSSGGLGVLPEKADPTADDDTEMKTASGKNAMAVFPEEDEP